MTDVHWERYPVVTQVPRAQLWLQIQANLGLAPNTIDAYGRAANDYFGFCQGHNIVAEAATKEHIALYVHDLTSRPSPQGNTIRVLDTGFGLANATLQQRITAIRLWYDYLVEEGIRLDNPVGRGRYTQGKRFGGTRERGLIPRYQKLPWIPTEEQWQRILETADDIDPSHRTLRIRAETTKNRMERVVPYSEETGVLYAEYLQERRILSRSRGPLFLSESDRNLARPISIWTWSKVVKGIAECSRVQQLVTHTFRHLCLTDLARSGWELHEIATFAGHRSVESTMRYIHLSGRDLSDKLHQGMQSIHRWRIAMMAEELT